MSINSKSTVLVTGFGPFDKHVVNASWEAVKELQTLWTQSVEFSDVELIAEEIPVSYNYVSTCIPQLWKKHSPSVSNILCLECFINGFVHWICIDSFIVSDCPACRRVASCHFFDN